MKTLKQFIFSLSLGTPTVVFTTFFFRRGTDWGMSYGFPLPIFGYDSGGNIGVSGYSFNTIGFVLDILIAGLIWFLLIAIFNRIVRKRFIHENPLNRVHLLASGVLGIATFAVFYLLQIYRFPLPYLDYNDFSYLEGAKPQYHPLTGEILLVILVWSILWYVFLKLLLMLKSRFSGKPAENTPSQ